MSGPPEMDECCATAREEVLANGQCCNARAITTNTGKDRKRTEPRHVADALRHEFAIQAREDIATLRLLKDGVDGALAEENERGRPLLLFEQGEDEHREEMQSHEHALRPLEVAGEVWPCHEPISEQQVEEPVQELMASVEAWHATALTTPAVVTEVVIFDSATDVLDVEVEDETEEGEMQQLLPCLDPLGQQVMQLDGKEVAHEDGFENNGDTEAATLGNLLAVDDADAEAATLGNLLAIDADEDTDDDVDADDGGTAKSSGTVIRCVADLFSLPAVPLLPSPLPSMPLAHVALPTPERRSSRLAAKPHLPAVEKAQRVLHKKMGLDVGDMPLAQATKEFKNTCKNAPFSDSAINGLRTLFRLNLPSMTAAVEALIGLAGPGGSDFPSPTVLDVFV